MRAIITGLDESGRSAALEIREITDVEVWKTPLDDLPEWVVGTEKLMSFEPDPGWAKCWALTTPPAAAEYVAPEGHDDSEGPAREVHDALTAGMHKTLVNEVIFIFDPIVLILEAGEVELRCGDIVVLRGILHDWRNPGPEPARTAGLSWAPPR